MNFVVKNTTKWGWLDLLCPHTCRGCGRLGTVFCECCKKYNISQEKKICPLCRQEFAEKLERCPDCDYEFFRTFVVGWRGGVLHKLVSDLKYHGVRDCADALVEMIDERLGDAEEMVIVPLPTIGRHVRERGLDHTMCLARKLAKKRGWKVKKLLVREKDSVQVGADAAQRKKQAKEAYRVIGEIEREEHYLLLDDVWTTGATMTEAAKKMREAGARKISMAVIEMGR